jgi:hypothetical protein
MNKLLVKLFLTCGTLLSTGCLCSDERTQAFEDPSSKMKIEVTVRNCGASTNFVSNVTLSGLNPDNQLILRAEGNQKITPKWFGDSLLEIEHSFRDKDIFFSVSRIAGVDVKLVKRPESE